jgi:hypothetical protein
MFATWQHVSLVIKIFKEKLPCKIDWPWWPSLIATKVTHHSPLGFPIMKLYKGCCLCAKHHWRFIIHEWYREQGDGSLAGFGWSWLTTGTCVLEDVYSCHSVHISAFNKTTVVNCSSVIITQWRRAVHGSKGSIASVVKKREEKNSYINNSVWIIRIYRIYSNVMRTFFGQITSRKLGCA